MKNTTSKITDLMALLVFALFAMCILMVLLTGADVYRDLVREGVGGFSRRTAQQYVTTRVRQAQTIRMENFGGCDALVTAEETNGETYLTRIYCYDGWLRELYAAETADLSPEDGEKLLEAEALTLMYGEPLLRAQITLADGSCVELILSIRSGQEVGP